MAEREVVRWITIKGNHIPIYANTISEDVLDYSQYKGDPSAMCMELYKRTGINMSGQLKNVQEDTLVEICTTLEDLQKKYHINPVEDPDTLEGDRLEVHVALDYEHQFESEKLEDAFACADMCKISLNPKYYCEFTPEELDEMYAEGLTGSSFDNYHPKGTSSKDIIAHEAAHSMLDRKVWEMVEHDSDRYFRIQRFLTENVEYTGVSEDTHEDIKMMFKKVEKIRKKYIKQLKQDEEAVKFLGNSLNDRAFLRYMADPYMFGKYGISGYAKTNYHELVAEAFADFYANGKEARPLSKIVVEEMLGIK